MIAKTKEASQVKRKIAGLNIPDNRNVVVVKVKKAVQTKPRSDAFEAIHSAASGLHKAGIIDQATMRDFDKSCLVQIPKYQGKDVRRIRRMVHVSQAVLAVHMNVSLSAVQKWETDAKPVTGAAAKLLNIVERKGKIDAIA